MQLAQGSPRGKVNNNAVLDAYLGGVLTQRFEIRGNLAVAYGRTAVVMQSAVALLGANGAGKDSSILRAISHQQVTLLARCASRARTSSITAAPAIASLGIAHAPEARGTFGDLICAGKAWAPSNASRQGRHRGDIARMQTLFPCCPAARSGKGAWYMLDVKRIKRHHHGDAESFFSPSAVQTSRRSPAVRA